MVLTAGRDWQHKFKGQKHIGLAILVKVQQIIAKFALAAEDPDVEEWNFKDSPIMHDGNLDLQEAFHLMEFFLQDLHRAIIQQEIFNFHTVPQLYTTLYPAAAATSSRGSDRNDATPVIEMVVDLAEDREDPIKEVTIFGIPVPQAATCIIQIVTIPIKIRVFSSVKECRILNPRINRMERPTHQK